MHGTVGESPDGVEQWEKFPLAWNSRRISRWRGTEGESPVHMVGESSFSVAWKIQKKGLEGEGGIEKERGRVG